MTNMNIGSAVVSEQSSNVASYTVDPKRIDGVLDQKETFYQNHRWSQQYGYFAAIPDLKSAIVMKAVWTVGKGFSTDTETEKLMEKWIGWGKDTELDILFNMELIKRIGGDALAEIVRDPETNLIINLKVLDPGRMGWYVNKQGMITRYEDTINKNTYKPEEIFHLSNNRIANQIHGTSDIDALEKTILADEENFDDVKKVMHRQARPLIIFKIATDKESEIRTFMAKMDEATNKGENIYIPFDDKTVSYEVVQVTVSNLLLAWREETRNRFYRSIGLPQVVPGAGGQSTESESKVIYLAFEQIVEREQRQIERQMWNQLTIKIDLIPPASITPDLQNDTSKDGAAQQLSIQPSDTQAGVGR